MAQLKCPHCGQNFTVDDTELGSIIAQIRDGEFSRELDERVKDLAEKHRHEMDARLMDARLSSEKKLQEAEEKNLVLQTRLDSLEKQQKLQLQGEINEIELRLTKENEKRMEDLREKNEKDLREVEEKLRRTEDEKRELQRELASTEERQELAVMKAVKKVEDAKRDVERDLANERENAKQKLAEKDAQIDFYRDLKTKMSTKMVGETLEQHCEIQFNQLRATAFRNAYFEKDNDARTGSKGDYIYREEDENGYEIVSIMFEMKNEMDTTATKHKNEDFLKELDKDRKEKNCEYAVLVSLLESDSDLYNAGIVDVSYKYEKMYVVRPQCFIPIITLLRNAAMNSLAYKQELMEMKTRDIDITHFEEKLLDFKEGFSNNYDRAHRQFDKAIEEIEKTIDHLQKVRDALLSSDNQLRLANKKVDEVSIQKLTRGNATMKAKFEALEKGEE